jgi:hypothetical protein
VFSGIATSSNYDDMYNDIPQYDDRRDDFVWDNNEGSHRRVELGSSTSGIVARSRAQTWNSPSELNNNESRSSQFQKRHFNSTYSDSAPSTPTSDKKGPPPGRPSAPKPVFKPATRAATLGTNQAVALYTFHAAEPGDLGFHPFPRILMSDVLTN